MRIDRLLCHLRFARTRSAAQKLVEQGYIRRNGERVTRSSLDIHVGDVLTIPLGNFVRLIEILELPERRGPPREAQACYRELDPKG
ncbi:RNA-binding S4 domain-containing protein [Qipengyuania sp. 6B39]|uniref:RNA-binding S4 domain-containing protein n=1 Tax=Qipengyuania proteolytica TaxID=2867239 RepID=UPI001C89F7EF|nr:S4 domain-containing protein [Qipengyuania proteolytica]MBX7494601.1 RNA-binding S4 domain-containing protein [Qipengyuania proteolytica]